MTDTPEHPEATGPAPPEFPARRDELLSAALDGALVDAVGDLGVTPAEIAALDEVDARARQTDLRAAGRAIGTVPPLDELTRARLVRHAIEAAAVGAGHEALTPSRLSAQSTAARRSPQRSRRWLLPAASVAAAVALVGGIGVAFNDDDRQVADQTELANEQFGDVQGPIAAIDYGEVDDVALRDLLAGKSVVAGASSRGSGESDPLTPETESGPAVPPIEDPPNVTYDTAAAAACLAELNPGGVLPQVIGVASVDGRDGLVAIADEPGRRSGWVVSTDVPCSVLLSAMVRS